MTPRGWSVAPLGLLLERLCGGGTPSRQNAEFWGGTIPWASVKDMGSGRLSRTKETITSEALAASAAQLIPAGAVVVATRMNVGAVSRTVVPTAINQDLKALIPGPSLDRDFLFFLLGSKKDHFAGQATGSTVKGIRQEALTDLILPWPPISEQCKIAAVLSSMDDAIEATQAVIGQLNVVKKAMMAELLTRGLPGRHTRFKQTEIGEVPKDWAVVRIVECCTIRNDLRKPINQVERAKIPGPYPYYGPTRAVDSINEWRLDGTFALIGEDGDHFLKFDRWSMTQLVSGRFNVNNHAHVIAGTPRCSAEWFAVFFQHRDLTSKLTRQGANRYKLRKATVEELLIPLPSPDEQATIVRSLAWVDARIAIEQELVQEARQLKSALMSVLLTGEVRVSPDEAAA
jgi:restriction endonuclease S subunit